jgi:cold shock protein
MPGTEICKGRCIVVDVRSLDTGRTRVVAIRKESSMARGTIKRIQRDKGFGFIRDNSGQEYFFHRSAVQGSFDSLSEGQRVSFDEEQSPKGPRAGNVRAE